MGGQEPVVVCEEVTATGPRLRIALSSGAAEVVLDPLELEGLTRLPYTAFPPLEGAPDRAGVLIGHTDPEATLQILRNEFAMVGIGFAEDEGGGRLVIRNMGSGAEVLLAAEQLARLTGLRHAQLAPLVDPSGLVAAEEPDPDQV